MIIARRAVFAATIAITAILSPRHGQAQAPVRGFRMPSDNIFCMYEPAVGAIPSDVRCDIVQMTSAQPPRPPNCRFAWGDAFAITGHGNIGVRICHGDTTRDDALPVLPYGTARSWGGFSCLSATNGLRCENAAGHGFFLSRAVQRLF